MWHLNSELQFKKAYVNFGRMLVEKNKDVISKEGLSLGNAFRQLGQTMSSSPVLKLGSPVATQGKRHNHQLTSFGFVGHNDIYFEVFAPLLPYKVYAQTLGKTDYSLTHKPKNKALV